MKPITKSSPLSPDAVVKAALTHIHQCLFRQGQVALNYAADHESLFEYLSKDHAGIRFPSSVRSSEYVLFEWRRLMPKGSTNQEIVLFTPQHMLQKVVEIYQTKRGEFSVATLRVISLQEILSYARVYPTFAEFVVDRTATVSFRIQKYRKLFRVTRAE